MNQNKLQRVEKARIAKRSNIKNAVYWGWRNPTHHVEIERAVAQGIPRKFAVSWYREIDRRNRKKYRQKKKTLHHSTDQSTDEESEIIFSD